MSYFNNKFVHQLILLVLGAICVLGFSPFYVYPASLISLGGLSYFLQQSKTTKNAAWLGFLYGLGLFGVGIYWIYISLHDFGGMPSFMAGFATFLLSAFMASFIALTTACAYWLTSKVQQNNKTQTTLLLTMALAVIWGLADWTRSWIFTGFPWLTMGYTQVPDGPLAGFMPVIGVYGVSTLTVLLAGLMTLFMQHTLFNQQRNKTFANKVVGIISILLVGGFLLKQIQWSEPTGEPIETALLQGNIAQDLKWAPEITAQTISRYIGMVKQSQAKLIILPETAFPILSNQITPEIKTVLTDHAKANNGNILLGIVEYDEINKAYFNGALSVGSEPTQHYEKSHLVPFGEFIPFKQIFGWIYRDLLNMPMSDMSRGATNQTPMTLSNQKIAVNVCYEDVFGEEIIRQLPEATLLVNVTNDAWYGESFAADQHMQFSQARALETGRTVLRATNTGATAMIDPKGNVLAHAPHFIQTTLNVSAQPYTGITPYVRFGNWLFIILSFGAVALLLIRKYR
jgi:apolipoprotein N-acyltransferase